MKKTLPSPLKECQKPEARKEQGTHLRVWIKNANTTAWRSDHRETNKQTNEHKNYCCDLLCSQHTSMMSFQTASELDLVTVNTDKSTNAVSTKNDETTPHQQEILQKQNKVFQGLGKLSDFQATRHIDKSVKPVTQKPRRRPSTVGFTIGRQEQAKKT